MTFSIVAVDRPTGYVAAAAASRFLAVGAYVLYARSGAGAAATQARTNPLLGVDALQGMATGRPVNTLLEKLLRADPDRSHRQLHMTDLTGATAAWTGPDCVGWAGHQTFDGFSVAGNMLTSSDVLVAMAAAYRELSDRPFTESLLAALAAGEIAGGDRRGRQSAAIVVFGEQPYPELDLRVDDHEQPLVELQRLHDLSKGDQVRALRAQMPGR